MLANGPQARAEEELRLRYDPIESGIRVFFDWDEAIAPPQGWPTPPSWGQDPLCEATRGEEIDFLGAPVRLHESLCVTIDEPRRLRIQVAYGHSFAEFDRERSAPLIGQGWPGEVLLFPHIAELTGMPPNFFLPPSRRPSLPS